MMQQNRSQQWHKMQQNYNNQQMAASKKNEYMLPPLRQKIDHYSYAGKESIGKGFSSSVFRGRDDNTEQQVAIKIIDMKSMKGEIHKNLLAGEIQILSLIKNKPNLLDVHKICSDKNKTYIITDFCEGGDLGKLIKSKKKLSQTESTRIVREIIKGYQSLYSLGIVHRDLKPANIFFHNSHLEIGDFGFAVKQQNLKLTERYNVGSPVYMPPQALNSNKYSHKSDIWAIGVIFYQMLTGTTPWTGRTETELKAKMKTISIRNILPPAINKASTSFLKKALETDPKKRMEPYQMFQHFDLNHENEEENDIYANEQNNRLFRSMRKSTRNQMFENTRGDSMKKTTNALVKKAGSMNPEHLQNTAYGATGIPKTALQVKIDKEYLSGIQKRVISKQLLSQVHFCRFLYKLIANIKAGSSFPISHQLEATLIGLLFYKLKETRELRLVDPEAVEEYAEFGDCRKLQKLVEEYLLKYSRRLGENHESAAPVQYTNEMYQAAVADMTRQIRSMFEFISNSREPSFLVKQIVILDYLVTLTQLVELLRLQNLQHFHNKSKIQAIVDGEAIAEVSAQHVRMIGDKLLALRII